MLFLSGRLVYIVRSMSVVHPSRCQIPIFPLKSIQDLFGSKAMGERHSKTAKRDIFSVLYTNLGDMVGVKGFRMLKVYMQDSPKRSVVKTSEGREDLLILSPPGTSPPLRISTRNTVV